jgi:hypothetical protein
MFPLDIVCEFTLEKMLVMAVISPVAAKKER